jgi:hypothetical protein
MISRMYSYHPKLVGIQHSEHKFVLFENSVDCFFAQKILNGHLITDLNLQLYVRWATQPELADFHRKVKLAGPNFPEFDDDVPTSPSKSVV